MLNRQVKDKLINIAALIFIINAVASLMLAGYLLLGVIFLVVVNVPLVIIVLVLLVLAHLLPSTDKAPKKHCTTQNSYSREQPNNPIKVFLCPFTYCNPLRIIIQGINKIKKIKGKYSKPDHHSNHSGIISR